MAWIADNKRCAGRDQRCCARTALLAAGVLTLISGGCATLRRGPVPESVATGRQLSQQGASAMQQGEWDRAETLLKQSIQSCPSNIEARRQYAEALWHRGAPREALAQLDAAMKLDPTDAALPTRFGAMCLALGDYDAATHAAARGLQLNSQCSETWALRGRLLLATGQQQQGLADLHRALSYAPDSPELLLEVAEVYRQRGQPQRALTTLQHLADIYPPGEEPQQVLYLMGLAYTALRRYEDARESLYAASVRGQPTAQMLCSLAEAEHLAGHPVGAETNVRQALAIDPGHAPSRALFRQLELARRPSGPALRQ